MSLAQGKPLIVALALSAAMGMASSGWAQSQQDQSSAGRPATSAAPATDVRPIPPSRAEMSDSAFKKLDAAGKGYVSPDDTRGLDNFGPAFQQSDANRDGKLTADEFRKAWITYTGND